MSDEWYSEVATRLREGSMVPFFGAGASAYCGLPSSGDLVSKLIAAGELSAIGENDDLAFVASYVEQAKDSVVVRRTMREALAIPHAPGPLHEFLAGFPSVQLYVTTNYDDLLETALARRSPWVVVDRQEAGIVWCRAPNGSSAKVKANNLRSVIRDSNNPIILKLHGSLAEKDANDDSFLITEDQYVRFLGRPNNGQVPPMLFDKMAVRSFLFLGYRLRDWNVRVLLRRLDDSRTARIESWAIVKNVNDAERAVWKRRNVELCDIDLAAFVQRLKLALDK
jgi:hypothetical protein